ncbi:peptide ABC transporter substrate-binding protein [Phenylobacterium sp.]|uniref:peptide ABC transporter substrate-binding protein n=1 Tax=Phenylobacterium sp. TaxID=1871053 RepID=UPI002FDB0894
MRPPPLRLLIPLLVALALAACQEGPSRPACPAGQVCLEFGNNTEPATLDPQQSNLIDEFQVIGDLNVGLTTDAPDGTPIPALAERWEVSADGLVWTFHLREARWSDGAPITADDFVFAYRRILAPQTASIYAYLVFLLKNGAQVNAGEAPPQALGARALNPRTLELTLDHPAPYLPEMLKHLSFFPVPRHVVEAKGEAWVRPGNYVSSGPYQLVSWRLGEYIEVTRNPYFWDADKVCVDTVRYYPTPDQVTAERRVAAGELDINTGFQSNRLSRIREAMPGYARTHISLATSYLSFNTRGVPAFRDPRVRKALSAAIDRDFITDKLLRAGQVPAYAFVPPGTANYVASGPQTSFAGQTLEARQALARDLLRQAGYGPEWPLEVEIKTGNTPDSTLMMQAIQADWQAVGVKVRLVQNEGQIAFAAYRMRDFQVGAMSWYADYNDPLTFLELLKSDTGAQNYGDYANPAYDALLAAANGEPDLEARARLLAEAEALMLSEDALVPLLFVVNKALVAPRVTGWVDNIANFHRARWLCVAGAEARAGAPDA